jgi:hypothetical protein
MLTGISLAGGQLVDHLVTASTLIGVFLAVVLALRLARRRQKP